MNTLVAIFGSGRDLMWWQMAARAFALFVALLALIRIAGMRSFGRKSSFDAVIVITLGAVMSRAMVGVSPAFPTLCACLVLALLHRTVAMITASSATMEHLVKGRSQVVYSNGVFDVRGMRLQGISRGDIDQALRQQGVQLGAVREIRLETSGQLTVEEQHVKKADLAPAGARSAAVR